MTLMSAPIQGSVISFNASTHMDHSTVSVRPATQVRTVTSTSTNVWTATRVMATVVVSTFLEATSVSVTKATDFLTIVLQIMRLIQLLKPYYLPSLQMKASSRTKAVIRIFTCT